MTLYVSLARRLVPTAVFVDLTAGTNMYDKGDDGSRDHGKQFFERLFHEILLFSDIDLLIFLRMRGVVKAHGLREPLRKAIALLLAQCIDLLFADM